MNQIKQLLVRFTLLAFSLMLLAACGGSEPAANTATALPTAASSTATAVETVVETISDPVVVSGSGDITAVVEEYRQLLGGVNHGGEPGSQGATGYREINWDSLPDELAAPNDYAPDFFNAPEAPRARGILLFTPGDGLVVSADGDNPYGALPRFGHINPTYADIFPTFSEERLFSPVGSNIVEATFYVPGSQIPAGVRGFGAVYADVDTQHTAFEYFDAEGNSLGAYEVPIADKGLSFLGLVFPQPIVHKVRIHYGTAVLGPDDGYGNDVAVMDNFIYGEPQPLAAATGFTGAIPGSQAFVAFVREGQHVLAYVCDGQATADWFRGEVQNEALDLAAKSGARLQATFNAGGVGGTFTPAGGAPVSFTAGAVTAPAGLYRSEGTAEGAEYVGGLIILPDGQSRGLVQSGTQHFIVEPDPLDIQGGSSNLLANVNWGDGIGLPFTPVKINE